MLILKQLVNLVAELSSWIHKVCMFVVQEKKKVCACLWRISNCCIIYFNYKQQRYVHLIEKDLIDVIHQYAYLTTVILTENFRKQTSSLNNFIFLYVRLKLVLIAIIYSAEINNSNSNAHFISTEKLKTGCFADFIYQINLMKN